MTVILATSLCWLLNDGDLFEMLVPEILAQNRYVGDFFRYFGDFLNVLNRSSTSQTCHQHI